MTIERLTLGPEVRDFGVPVEVIGRWRRREVIAMFGSKAASAAVVMTVAAVVLGLGSPAVAQAGVTSSGSQVADQFAAETSFPHSQIGRAHV